MARTRRVYRTPWAQALKYFSSEDELARLAKADSTASNWRKLGVPADVLLPITIRLTDQLLARRLPPVGDRAQRLPEWVSEMEEIAKLAAETRGDLLEVLRDLRVIQALAPELFEDIRKLVHTQRDRLEPAAPARKRKSG